MICRQNRQDRQGFDDLWPKPIGWTGFPKIFPTTDRIDGTSDDLCSRYTAHGISDDLLSTLGTRAREMTKLQKIVISTTLFIR